MDFKTKNNCKLLVLAVLIAGFFYLAPNSRLGEAFGRGVQSAWDWVIEICNGNCFLIAIVGTNLVATVGFWLMNIPLLYMDLTGRPKFLTQYKVQLVPEIVDRQRLKKAAIRVLTNQLIWSQLSMLLFYPLMKWRGITCSREIISFQRFLAELLFFVVCEEIGFYYSHRMFHHPVWYRHIHKKHHEWTAPVGIIAIYAHPLEHIISNLAPIVLGPFILGSTIPAQWAWFLIALLATTISHSGYHLPFLPSPEFHDFHHYQFNSNFGVLGILDWFHGTDVAFRKSKAFSRHMISMSTVPLRHIYPDKT